VERQHVAGARQGLHLTCEYLVEPMSLAHAVRASCRGERDGAQRRPVGLVAHDVLGREMLRVRRAAAVAGEEQRSVGAQSRDVGLGDRRDRLGVLLPTRVASAASAVSPARPARRASLDGRLHQRLQVGSRGARLLERGADDHEVRPACAPRAPGPES